MTIMTWGRRTTHYWLLWENQCLIVVHSSKLVLQVLITHPQVFITHLQVLVTRLRLRGPIPVSLPPHGTASKERWKKHEANDRVFLLHEETMKCLRFLPNIYDNYTYLIPDTYLHPTCLTNIWQLWHQYTSYCRFTYTCFNLTLLLSFSWGFSLLYMNITLCLCYGECHTVPFCGTSILINHNTYHQLFLCASFSWFSFPCPPVPLLLVG